MLRSLQCQGTASRGASSWTKQLRRIRARQCFRSLAYEPLEDRRLLAGPSIQGVEMAQVMHEAAQSFFGSEPGGKGGPLQSVGLDLAYLFHENKHYDRNPQAAPFQPRNGLLKIADQRVVVDVLADGDPLALKEDLLHLGMEVTGTWGSLISGLFPVKKIDKLAALDSVRFVRPYMGATSAGLGTTQGDSAQRSDDLRTALGVDGTGITVGVLSDSFDNLGGWTADVASGDLPGPEIPGDTRSRSTC